MFVAEVTFTGQDGSCQSGLLNIEGKIYWPDFGAAHRAASLNKAPYWLVQTHKSRPRQVRVPDFDLVEILEVKESHRPIIDRLNLLLKEGEAWMQWQPPLQEKWVRET